MSEGRALRFASYNVHRCIGRDGRYDPERVIAVVQELGADVVALQEVESHPHSDRDFLALLTRSVGMRAIAGPTLLDESYHYGNVLLTRVGVRSVRRIDLSLLDREPRGALDLDLEFEGAPLRVMATHLGLHPLERRFQIRQLLDLLSHGPDKPTVLLGDINEWFAWGRPLRWLHGHFGKPPAPRSFPAGLPLFALDRIWMSPRERLTGVRVHRSQRARLASDHLPVIAEVRAV
jgi:endonuclease/exonuclease/phosphatase family metal-dependent hydrolase